MVFRNSLQAGVGGRGHLMRNNCVTSALPLSKKGQYFMFPDCLFRNTRMSSGHLTLEAGHGQLDFV